jgi:hypothetical protein
MRYGRLRPRQVFCPLRGESLYALRPRDAADQWSRQKPRSLHTCLYDVLALSRLPNLLSYCT